LDLILINESKEMSDTSKLNKEDIDKEKINRKKYEDIYIKMCNKPKINNICYMSKHQRISLKIPRKFVITLTPEQLINFIIPDNATVTIKLEGDASVLKEVLSLDSIKELTTIYGIKIIPIDTTPLKTMSYREDIKTKMSFFERLIKGVNEHSVLVPVFNHIFINNNDKKMIINN
jgi:hypothetical protein